MKLISFETSRIVYLTMVHRAAGGVYLPEAAAKLIQRYSFAKYPSLDELAKESQTFSYGKFRDVQITEFSLYNDGLIVAGRCSTEILDGFVEDLLVWMEEAFGVTQVSEVNPEKYFESNCVVKSDADLAAIVAPNKRIVELVSTTLTGATGVQYRPTGAVFDCDQADVGSARFRRKPMRFLIERKLGLPYSSNSFYSQAPIRTEDHLALLEKLEASSR